MLSTSAIGNKISPVAYPVPALDQFGAVTGPRRPHRH